MSQQPHAETNKYSNHSGTRTFRTTLYLPPLEPPSVRPLGPKRKQMKRCFLFYISSIRLHHNRFFSHSPPKICSKISQLRSKTSNYVNAHSILPKTYPFPFLEPSLKRHLNPLLYTKRKMKQVAVATHSTSLQESSKRVRSHYTHYSLPRRGPLK